MGYLRAGLLLVSLAVLHGQAADPAYAFLEKAYNSLKIRDYGQAIDSFQRAIEVAPDRAAIHKDLAYTLLKIGEPEAARDHFAEAMRIDPSDTRVAMEYAFLCYETREQLTARRVFERLAKTGDPTAVEAFENIDRPLREGIARWSEAVRIDPNNFSAHEELARLAEQRDELELARQHYQTARQLKPDRRDLLLDLGRILKEQDRVEESIITLLAASRGAEPRVQEEARELLPERYPYVYEFEQALALDPANVDLRREFAYLHLAMGHDKDAEAQFGRVLEAAPQDLLSTAQLGFLLWKRGDEAAARPLLEKVLAGPDEELADRVRTVLNLPQTLKRRPEQPRVQLSNEAKTLAYRSLDKGYLQDALKYLHVAHENDPVDFDVMLKLGWTNNILKDDREALRWFNLASRSPEPKIAAEATKAYRNLKPAQERFHTTIWAFPVFSSRWGDLFTYAQAKTELRLQHFPLRPYVSARFIGDVRGKVDVNVYLAPQYLSERSLILGAGVATVPWRGVTGWFEAGEAMRYRTTPSETGRMLPDYRGGVAYAKGFGNLLAKGSHGKFAETNTDGVFISRFGNDSLAYFQNRVGYTFRARESLGGLHPQVLWNFDATGDLKGQYWANFVETGPGVKFRLEQLPSSVLFSINLMHGVYLINEGNPRRPNYNEVKVSVWYALSH
jgi:Tfp pilus assembly protein PilF